MTLARNIINILNENKKTKSPKDTNIGINRMEARYLSMQWGRDAIKWYFT